MSPKVVKIIATLSFSWFLAFLTTARSNFASNLSHNLMALPYFDISLTANNGLWPAYNTTKLALMIEGEPSNATAPALLHNIAIAPADWPFLFFGTNASVTDLFRRPAIRQQVAIGKLKLQIAPDGWNVTGREGISQLLSSGAFYKRFVDPAEWLFTISTKSVLCANSPDDLNNWLGYDWVSAPVDLGGRSMFSDRTGGDNKDRGEYNGGLALRRVSTLKKILHFQERIRSEWEDAYFLHRLPLLPGGPHVVSKENGTRFAVKDKWYETPMGFLGTDLQSSKDVWEKKEQRDEVWKWCPDVKMVLPMEIEDPSNFKCAKGG